jgi:hypothetical protein
MTGHYRAGRTPAASGGRHARSFGQVGGVASERPLVLLELIAVDAVNGKGDQCLDRFGAAPGASESQREENFDRCQSRTGVSPSCSASLVLQLAEACTTVRSAKKGGYLMIREYVNSPDKRGNDIRMPHRG